MGRKYSFQNNKTTPNDHEIQVHISSSGKKVKFLQSHPPITEKIRLCSIAYLNSMFKASTGSSSGTVPFYLSYLSKKD
jgi:hypothetical protein